MSIPGAIISGLVLIDDPASIAVTRLINEHEVLMSVLCRPGGTCDQVLIGLTQDQAKDLIKRLQAELKL